MGCYSPPLLKEISSWVLRRRGAQETMKDALTTNHEGQRDSWKEEDFSITPATFPFEHGRHGTLLNQIVLHDSACIVLPYSVFLIQRLKSDTQNGKEHSEVPKSRTTSFIEIRIYKLNQTLALLKMTFSWITEQDRYMNAWVRSWWHGSEVDRHHVGYLLKISDTRALVGQMVDGWKTTTIRLDDRGELRSTLGWKWMICSTS
jgi:hypothetical protein